MKRPPLLVMNQNSLARSNELWPKMMSVCYETFTKCYSIPVRMGHCSNAKAAAAKCFIRTFCCCCVYFQMGYFEIFKIEIMKLNRTVHCFDFYFHKTFDSFYLFARVNPFQFWSVSDIITTFIIEMPDAKCTIIINTIDVDNE